MARRESDREDLMREATALRRRVAFGVRDAPEPVVVGFHSDGRFSIYLGQDPVFHFDAESRLRRAFSDGTLYRTQGSTLAQLERTRTAQHVALDRADLNARELADFQSAMHSELQRFQTALVGGRVDVRQQIPEGDEQLVPDVQAAVASVLSLHEGWLAPALPGKP